MTSRSEQTRNHEPYTLNPTPYTLQERGNGSRNGARDKPRKTLGAPPRRFLGDLQRF